ncbi:MAG: prephenate dehydrogenase/arogenate dehydrogenase family protein, partial [Clostridia bacterium]|nr:prephenate dehydrogenase/arogenate dehydrogenase family protein [Clostridia bacterium]
MNVGIVGLGLIGGSFVKAYKKANNTVYVYNRSQDIVDFAIMNGDVDYKLDKTNMNECDLIIISLYPNSTVEFLNNFSQYFNKNSIVIDACGIKKSVCKCGFKNADKFGYTFVGAHPMAGTHNSGYKYSRADMFKNAPMVLVPPTFDDINLLDKVEKMLAPCGFGSFSVTTAKNHDEMIAFTSQMPHIISNAFIKSPTAATHKGFSAGS